MKTYSIFLILLQSIVTIAQAPQKMSYQSVVRNAANQIVVNQSIGVKISIIEGSLTGTTVYSETHTTTTNANGLFTLEAGGGTPTAGNFATINWGNGSHYIKSEIDVTGGTNYSLSGTMELLSVPYALYAERSGSTSGNTGGLTHYVGELFGGGIIVAVWKKNGEEHGLIASLTNLSTGIIWSSNFSIGTDAQSSQDGLSNTNAIVASQGEGLNYAAGLCKAYNAGGYTDWYLPAINELVICFNSCQIVNEVLGDTNAFLELHYWSSTNTNPGIMNYNVAASINFLIVDPEYGTGTAHPSFFSNAVRAVRRF